MIRIENPIILRETFDVICTAFVRCHCHWWYLRVTYQHLPETPDSPFVVGCLGLLVAPYAYFDIASDSDVFSATIVYPSKCLQLRELPLTFDVLATIELQLAY